MAGPDGRRSLPDSLKTRLMALKSGLNRPESPLEIATMTAHTQGAPMRVIALSAVLLLAACAKEPSAPAVTADADRAAKQSAVVNAPAQASDAQDPYLAALERQEARPAIAPAPPAAPASIAAPAPAGASALDAMRINTTNAEAMAESLRQFGLSATVQEQEMIRQAILVALLTTQQQLALEASSGRQVALDEQSLFVRTFGGLNGKTYRQIYREMQPHLPRLQQAYVDSLANRPNPLAVP